MLRPHWKRACAKLAKNRMNQFSRFRYVSSLGVDLGKNNAANIAIKHQSEGLISTSPMEIEPFLLSAEMFLNFIVFSYFYKIFRLLPQRQLSRKLCNICFFIIKFLSI